MRTTIDLPDPLYKKAKASAALRGVKLRELFADALQTYLDGKAMPASNASPEVTAADLEDYPDAGSLQRAFPNGYRIVGPLIGSPIGAAPLLAARVAEINARLDEEELGSYGRAR